jgi:hypothetical protein
MKSKIFLTIAVLIAAVGSGCLATIWNQHEAEQTLHFIRDLRMGQLLSDEQAKEKGFSPRGCDSGQCTFERTIQNGLIHFLKLAPTTVYRAAIVTHQGRVTGFLVAIGQPGSAEASVSDSARDEPMLKAITVVKKQEFIDVYLTSRTTEAERSAALDLRLSILSQFGKVNEVSSLFMTRPPQTRD